MKPKPPPKPRLWVFCELYYPEEVATGYHLTSIAEGLAEDFDVNVITGPASSNFQPVQAMDEDWRNGAYIYRCGGTRWNKDALFGRLVNMLTRTWAMFRMGLRHVRRGDAMLVVTNPPLLPFAVLLLKWLKLARFVLLIYDVYPEVLVASGLSRPNSLLVRLGRVANRLLYRQATRVISIGRDMSRLVQARLGSSLAQSRVHLIPNWAELESVHVQPRRQNPWLSELGLQDKFVVLYAGTLGRTHGLETLVDAAVRLRGQDGVHFLVAGFGARESWLRAAIARGQMANISLHHFNRPRQEQGQTLSACDVGLISFMPGMAGVSVPSRMYNLMAAGRAIIAVTDSDSELAQVVREEEIGWVVPPNDGVALAHAVLEARRQPELLQEMGRRAAQAARAKYTQEHSLEAYRKLFRELHPGRFKEQRESERQAA